MVYILFLGNDVLFSERLLEIAYLQEEALCPLFPPSTVTEAILAFKEHKAYPNLSKTKSQYRPYQEPTPKIFFKSHIETE